MSNSNSNSNSNRNAARSRFAIVSLVAMVSMGSMGSMVSINAHAERLTSQDCHNYPFVQTGAPTHQQIGHEMKLLERDGYNPAAGDFYYPDNMQAAEQQLQQDYARDCLNARGQQSM
jgi:hypothetical protein